MDARKKKALITIVSLGSLFLVWRIYSLLDRVSPASAGAAPVSSTADQPQNADGAAPAPEPLDPEIMKAQRRVAEQPWGRDPFDPTPFAVRVEKKDEKSAEKVPEKPPPAPGIRFTGVSKTGDQWLAAVDGTIVRVGDTVQVHYKVVAISKASIALTFEGWTFLFELGAKEPIVRRMSENP